jgi:hypothetical protein
MPVRANVPIGSAQRITGHTNRTTTAIYLHSIRQADKQTTNVLDDQFAGQFLEKVSHQQKKGYRIVR